MTNTMRVTTILIAAGVLATGGWAVRRAKSDDGTTYRFATAAAGSVRSTVSATGTLGAVRTVQVGTQVSGQISEIDVDFNSQVKKGQLIARIDPTLQQQAVQDAQAGVAKANAQYAQAEEEYEREQKMHDQRIVTDVEYNTALTAANVSKADLQSAEITLDKAKQNLAYTNIYAPIDGVVIERDMDVGQTVAASLSAPQLFVIANDLSHMQILAAVDESDIGQIKQGQPVSFTVQSYPNQHFTGTVNQVRLSSTTANNVVSYTAVVSVDNPDGKLLPGMTATVQFITGSADNVLTVPNTALRFRPANQAESQSNQAANGGGSAGGNGAGQSTTPKPATNSGTSPKFSGTARPTFGSVYTLASDGSLVAHRVTTGLTDGTRTQIDGDITAGTQVVIGAAQGGASATAAPAASNPFQQQQTSGHGGRGGPPGPF